MREKKNESLKTRQPSVKPNQQEAEKGKENEIEKDSDKTFFNILKMLTVYSSILVRVLTYAIHESMLLYDI